MTTQLRAVDAGCSFRGVRLSLHSIGLSRRPDYISQRAFGTNQKNNPPSTNQWTLSGADQNPKQGNGGGIKRSDYLINARNN